MIQQLDFSKRARVEERHGFRRRIWLSRDGHYRVVESQPRYHDRVRQKDGSYLYKYVPLRAVCYAMILRGQSWDILSRHRRRERAFEACRKAARLNDEG